MTAEASAGNSKIHMSLTTGLLIRIIVKFEKRRIKANRYANEIINITSCKIRPG